MPVVPFFCLRHAEVPVKYLRRLLWYLVSRLLILCLVLGLMTIVFYYSMNATNVYIVLKDGMANRAQAIMMGVDGAEGDAGSALAYYQQSGLDRYFSVTYLDRDRQLSQARAGQSAYQNYYSITGFDHRISLDRFWCWPWDNEVSATITESIPAIDGKLKSSAREAAQAAGLTGSSPKWETTQYSVILRLENGQWHILDLTPTRVINNQQ